MVWKESDMPKERRSVDRRILHSLNRSSPGRIIHRIVAPGSPLHRAPHCLVSEAISLADPEGNGIEPYTDHPEALWPRRGTTSARRHRSGIILTHRTHRGGLACERLIALEEETTHRRPFSILTISLFTLTLLPATAADDRMSVVDPQMFSHIPA
jgi:hypothetical protein